MRIEPKEILIVFVLIMIAAVRFLFFATVPSADYYSAVEKNVTFTGMVSEYPDKRENQIRYTVAPVGQDFNIIVPLYESEQELHYGDIVNVSGVLTQPENFQTDTGKEFDYGKYLLANNTFFIIKNSEVEKVGVGGNFIKKKLFYVREKFEESLDRVLSIRDSGFVKGLLLGSKGGISVEDKDAFIKTGTIHIVALSGFNVMIVAEAVMRTISLFAYGVAAYLSGAFAIILFVIMAGFGSTAIRAGIMAVIALIARSTGRTYVALRALIVASLLMLVFNPRVVFDVSFHLSVIATFGVITLPAKIFKYFKWIPSLRGFRELMLATISASIVVIPYIMYVMGSFSTVSIIVNALILPFIPLIMLIGFLSGSFGLFSSILATPFSYITHLGDSYIFSITHFFASLPFASFNISKFPLIFLLAFYALTIYWIFKPERS